jgi:protein TonB
VDRVLAQRARLQARTRWGTSLGAALFLHGALLAAAIVLPEILRQPPAPLEFVPVHVIPAAALGTPNPRRAAPPPAPEPEPAAPEPAPQAETPPATPPDVPALPADEPPRPRRERTPEPRREEERRPARPEPAAPADAAGGRSDEGEGEGRRGAPTGSRSGTTVFGSQFAAVDPDFTFGYYLDQLLALIDARWQRPPVGEGVEAVLAFRIERDGRVSDLEVARSSGMNAFDLAALRAVQNAAPFPRLPVGYRKPSLAVNLIVR